MHRQQRAEELLKMYLNPWERKKREFWLMVKDDFFLLMKTSMSNLVNWSSPCVAPQCDILDQLIYGEVGWGKSILTCE